MASTLGYADIKTSVSFLSDNQVVMVVARELFTKLNGCYCSKDSTSLI